MSSGKRHDTFTAYSGHVVWFAGTLTTLWLGSSEVWYPAALTFGYLLGGWVLSPDLDCYPAISNPLKRWGWFRFIWYPYRRVVKHRSWVSHSYIVGVTLQLIYLFIMLLIIYSILFGILSVAFLLPNPRDAIFWFIGLVYLHQALCLSLWIGLVMGSGSHLALDGIFFKWK